VTAATFRQSLKPFTLVFEIWRRNRLRKKAVASQFALGQRMNETQIGDSKLRARIKALGERIQNIQDVKGDARQSIAERKDMMMKLAVPALASESAPEDISGEHDRARTIAAKLKSQEEALAGAMGGFMPPNGLAWRRVVIGYTMTLLVALGTWQVYMFATEGSRLAKKQDADLAASKQADDQKRQEDNAEWDKEKNSEQIYERCSPSVAMIRFKVGKAEGGGTGFMIRPGLLATNAHVIEDALPEDLKIYYPSVKELKDTPFAGRVIYCDRKRDLAFLAVEPKVPPLRLADNFEFKGGKSITIIGCPAVGKKQLKNAVNTGNLSTETEVEKMPFYQLGAPVNAGNSGGPVFDNRGQVIGVVTLKATQQESIGYCIPWLDLKNRLEALEKEDPYKTAALGQSNHNILVLRERIAGMSFMYLQIAARYTLAMQATRPAEEGIRRARPANDAILSRISIYLDGKHQAIGDKLVNDPNLPAEVRKKFGELWKTYQELKGLAENPKAPANAYASKMQDLANRFESQIKALRESLGGDSRQLEDEGADSP
jgi:S1-C subfamily serine protease